MAGYFAAITHERDTFESFLHHPAEVVAKVAVDGENVVGALVVGYKDVTRVPEICCHGLLPLLSLMR